MITTFAVLILLPQLLLRVTNVVASAANDYSVEMFFGNAFCENLVQDDVTNAVKNVCSAVSKDTISSNELFKTMASRIESLERKLDGALLKLANISSSPCRFGYEYYKQENFCYRFHARCFNWSEARKICQQEGGDLIQLKESHFNFFRDLARTRSTTECNHAWVGTTDIASPGQWKWLNGESISPSLWQPTQPDNNFGKENCGDLQKFYDYRLNDEDCSLKQNFICQIVL